MKISRNAPLQHITINSGDIAIQQDIEISPNVISVLTPMISEAIASPDPVAIQWCPGFMFSAEQHEDGALSGSIWWGNIPIVDLLVSPAAADPDSWDQIMQRCREVGLKSPENYPVPTAHIVDHIADHIAPPDGAFCAVILRSEIVSARLTDVMEWAGDFERSVAWTWLTREQ